MARQIRVFLSVQEFVTEGHEDRKAVFSLRELCALLFNQKEKRAGALVP
jgi:hypothetical protein